MDSANLVIEDSEKSNIEDCQPPSPLKSTSRKRMLNPSSSKKSTQPEKRVRKYALKWSEDPELACFSKYEGDKEENEGKAFCNICSKLIEGTISHLHKHLKTKYHVTRAKAVKSPSVPSLFTKKNLPARDAEKFKLMLLKFLCEHNISFNVMDHLLKMLKKRSTRFTNYKICEMCQAVFQRNGIEVYRQGKLEGNCSIFTDKQIFHNIR